jgi:hypothetical protein
MGLGKGSKSQERLLIVLGGRDGRRVGERRRWVGG